MPSIARLVPCLAALGALLAAAPTRAASVTRGPFLQQTTSASTLVVVDTDADATVEVVADLPGGRTATARSERRRHHLLRLEGLPAATAIPYRVTVDGAARPGGTFRTPGKPGTAAGRRATFAVIGDFGTGEPVFLRHVDRMREADVDAILTVGDNAYPDAVAQDFTDKLFEPMAPLLASSTFWPVAGDHEYRTPAARPYFDAFELPTGPQGERYYSFDWGDVHVVALESNCIVPMVAAEAGCDAKTMIAWLEADLAASAAPWKLALIHRPVVATGKYGVYPQIPAALQGVLEAGGVDLVLQGHNHLYERSWPTRQGKPVKKDYAEPGAPVYLTSGGAGNWLYDFALPAAGWTAHREKVSQHVILELDGGTLEVRSVKPDGAVHDRFTMTKEMPPLTTPPDQPGQPGQPGGPGASPGDGGEGGGCQSAAGGAGLFLVLPALLLGARVARRRVR